MTNTEMLERKIRESGLEIEELADVLRLSACDIRRKICGEEEFLVSELWALGRALGLDSNEMQEIFLTVL